MKKNTVPVCLSTCCLLLLIFNVTFACAAETASWKWLGGPPGGLGYDIRMHPDNPDIMYVTDAIAGIFKSTDGGLNWFPITSGITVRSGSAGYEIPVFCVTIDPHNPDTVWCGTLGKRGIFKSTDGGKNWVKKDNGIVEETGITFRGITVDPNDSSTVYAAGEISSIVWAGELRELGSLDMTMGVVYKTTDAGENWSLLWRGDNLARYVWIDPRDTKVIYISTGIFDRAAANTDKEAGESGAIGVVKTIDGGETWTQINNGINNLFINSLFMHPENPDILLAAAGMGDFPDECGVYRTSNGGQSWSKVIESETPMISVEISVSEPDVAYAAGWQAVYRSNDAGITWDRMTEGDEWGSSDRTAGFPIDLQVDPRDSKRLFANNYGGGNFISIDSGQTWVSASKGYTGGQVQNLSVDSNKPSRVVAGEYMTTNAGDDWTGIYKATFHMSVIAPSNSDFILGATFTPSLFGSEDGGENWSVLATSPLEGTYWRCVVFSPSDSTIVYTGLSSANHPDIGADDPGGQGIYVSSNGGLTWEAANDDKSSDANVWGIAVGHDDSSVVYAATSNHGVLKTTDNGKSWNEVNSGLPENMMILSIAVNPDDSETVYAGVRQSGLYKSSNGGTAWQQVSAGLPAEASIQTIVFNPENSEDIYCADISSGIYNSTDSGAVWTAVNDGLLNRDVICLAFSADGNHLYAGSDGSGAYRMDLKGTPPVTEEEPPNTCGTGSRGDDGLNMSLLGLVMGATLILRKRKKQ